MSRPKNPPSSQPGSPGPSTQARRAQPADLVYTPGVPTAARTMSAPKPSGPRRSPSPTSQKCLELLARHLTAEPAGTARLISEFWIPVSNARADLVVANGVLDGYEIKGPGDRLHRLPAQILAYERVFDHCTAVLAERHLPAAVGILPSWWGVTIVTAQDSCIEPVRPAGPNPSVDIDVLLRLLWRQELEDALRLLGSPAEPNVSRAELRFRIASLAPPDHTRQIVRHKLIERPDSSARIPTRRYATPLSSLS